MAVVLSLLERGFLLAFFALYVQAIRPFTLSKNPTTGIWLAALLGFAILLPVLTRLPQTWKPVWRWSLRLGGWGAAILFLGCAKYPNGAGFSLSRSDIIIVVLANMAVFGSLAWLLTRDRLLLRLGLLGVISAFRLSNMPQAVPGWVHDLWAWSPAPWIYKLYYLQYLFIVIPGTIAGDLFLKFLGDRSDSTPTSADASNREAAKCGAAARSWSKSRYAAVAAVMSAMVLVSLIGLKARWLLPTTLVLFVFCALGWWLLRCASTPIERLFHDLFGWAIYWIILGLCFEPYEGGIKKDKATLSYYFITSGLAICTFILLSILADVFGRRAWLQLFVDNGQNPMIAYAAINNLIPPLLALSALDSLLTAMSYSPWLGFLHGLTVTLLVAIFVRFCTRMRIYWRT